MKKLASIWMTILLALIIGSCSGGGGGGSTSINTPPPSSVPTGLVGVGDTTTSAYLSWTAPNTSVSGYNIYRDGVKVGTSTATVYSDTGLSAGSTYTYTVEAYDANGIASGRSATFSITIPTSDSSTGQNSSLAVREVAKAIYDAWEAHEDLTPYMSGVMAAFNVPTLGDADIAVASARLSQGEPLFTATQAARMAEAFSQNNLVTLSSFESALGAQGIQISFYGYKVPLQPGMLSMVMGLYSVESDSLVWNPDQVLPALVIALGKERVKRLPVSSYTDPIWGDLYLDPLQYTLLHYSIMSGPGTATAKAARKTMPTRKRVKLDGVAGWLVDKVAGDVTSEVGKKLEIPTDPKEGAQASLCASLLLYGHKLTVKTTPPEIYYIGAGSPNLSTVSAFLEFKDDYYKDDYYGGGASLDRWLLQTVTSCTFPRQGPVAGKAIEWSVSESLEPHGNYDITASQTDANGEALATWRANNNNMGEGCSPTNMIKSEFGVATAKVKGLVPGLSTIESVVGYFRGSDTGTTGESRLEVFHYDPADISCPNTEPHSF